MTQKQAAVVLFATSGVAVVVLAVAWKAEIPMSAVYARWIGLGFVGLGMLLVGLAFAVAGVGFHGAVDPVLHRLVTRGPYRFVRHPVYLGFALALLGVSLATRSYAGLVAVGLGFFPAAVYRARLEERALSERFGESWHEYTGRTAFMLPGIW